MSGVGNCFSIESNNGTINNQLTQATREECGELMFNWKHERNDRQSIGTSNSWVEWEIDFQLRTRMKQSTINWHEQLASGEGNWFSIENTNETNNTQLAQAIREWSGKLFFNWKHEGTNQQSIDTSNSWVEWEIDFQLKTLTKQSTINWHTQLVSGVGNWFSIETTSKQSPINGH